VDADLHPQFDNLNRRLRGLSGHARTLAQSG
jgi:hypothetical protein